MDSFLAKQQGQCLLTLSYDFLDIPDVPTKYLDLKEFLNSPLLFLAQEEGISISLV